jgi:hypothetical protein
MARRGGWSKETTLFMLHGQNDVFVPLEQFVCWKRHLGGFQDLGQGIGSIEWKLIDGVRHALTDPVWSHVRDTREKVIPTQSQKTTVKL